MIITDKESIKKVINNKFDKISEKIDDLNNQLFPIIYNGSFAKLEPFNDKIDENSELYKKIFKIVTNFYKSLSDTSTLCLYYTYYKLKLKGIHDFDYEFQLLENSLYNDFYYYALSQILDEGTTSLYIMDCHEYETESSIGSYGAIENYINKKYKNIMPINIVLISEFDAFNKSVEAISKYKEIKKADIYNLIKLHQLQKYLLYNSNTKERNLKIKKYGSIIHKIHEVWGYHQEIHMLSSIDFLYLVEKNLNYFTNPDYILKLMIKIFKENNFCYMTNEQFGGKRWKLITEIILSRDSMTKTMFIDTCWALQHNTNLALFSINSDEYILRFLEDIKNGVFKYIYYCAKEHNPKLERYIYKNAILENEINEPLDYTYIDFTKYIKNNQSLLLFDDKDTDYNDLDEKYGLRNATITKLNNELNPIIKLTFPNIDITYTTELDSFIKYINKTNKSE